MIISQLLNLIGLRYNFFLKLLNCWNKYMWAVGNITKMRMLYNAQYGLNIIIFLWILTPCMVDSWSVNITNYHYWTPDQPHVSITDLYCRDRCANRFQATLHEYERWVDQKYCQWITHLSICVARDIYFLFIIYFSVTVKCIN